MRKQLSKSEVKDLLQKIKDTYGYEAIFTPKDKVEMVDEKLVYINGEIQWFIRDELLIPHLKLLHKSNFLKLVTFDKGAIKFIAKGADVFRPGITAFDADIKEGELVALRDETHGKILAIGIASASTKTMEEQEGGKAIKNIHYVGDELWSI